METPTTQKARTPTVVDHVVAQYGDLLFDLCETVLWSSVNAQVAFRAILKNLRSGAPTDAFVEFERSWVLRTACDLIRTFAQKHGRRLSASEQIMLDASLNTQARLKQFDSYFHRLATDDQILFLLRDKYGLPYPEIASAMNVPEGALKVRRQQALRALDDWLWDQT